MDKTQYYINKSINIAIESKGMKTEGSLLFFGIITHAELIRNGGSTAATIMLNGYSTTIMMDGAPNSKSYSNYSLANIVQEISGNYQSEQIKTKISTLNNSNSSDYIVQYNESDFAFLSRMAQKRGEWFYYNGTNLHMGNPNNNKEKKEFTLQYGYNLAVFTIEMNSKPVNFEHIGYDPASGSTEQVSSSQINYQPPAYLGKMLKSSQQLYRNTGSTLYPNPIDGSNTISHLINRVTTQVQSQTAGMVIARGESDEPGLRIGDKIKIIQPKFAINSNERDNVEEQLFGHYIITSLVYNCEGTGTYSNTFEAVSHSVVSPPYGNIHSTPVAHTQPATVKNNNDPKGLGRVIVSFPWQTGHSRETPWIRLVNPHAGNGKGMYFIPEIGEEVLVAFENDNPEKPYVVGAMYNGNASSGFHTAGNDQKVIQTRSGAKIIINDAQKSIHIEDPSGNTFTMDGKGSVSLNAPKNFTINAGENIIMTAGKNIDATATTDISMNAGANMNVVVGLIKNVSVGTNYVLKVMGRFFESIAGNKETETDKKISINTQDGIEHSSEGEITKNSQKTVNINSAEKSNLF